MAELVPTGVVEPDKLEIHPAAELFPLMEGKGFEDLVEDIRKNGLQKPIMLDRTHRVLDGRNRLRACLSAAVEPRFEIWDGDGSSVVDLVVSLNLHRRHLNESQRAIVAAKLRETMRLSEAGTNLSPGKSADRAASLLNVSAMSVKHASNVLRGRDPKLIRAVESGELAVSKAADLAAGRKPRAARRPLAVSFGEAVLAWWMPPERLEEALKLLDRWGLERKAALPSEHTTLLIAARREAPADPGALNESDRRPGS